MKLKELLKTIHEPVCVYCGGNRIAAGNKKVFKQWEDKIVNEVYVDWYDGVRIFIEVEE